MPRQQTFHFRILYSCWGKLSYLEKQETTIGCLIYEEEYRAMARGALELLLSGLLLKVFETCICHFDDKTAL